MKHRYISDNVFLETAKAFYALCNDPLMEIQDYDNLESAKERIQHKLDSLRRLKDIPSSDIASMTKSEKKWLDFLESNKDKLHLK